MQSWAQYIELDPIIDKYSFLQFNLIGLSKQSDFQSGIANQSGRKKLTFKSKGRLANQCVRLAKQKNDLQINMCEFQINLIFFPDLQIKGKTLQTIANQFEVIANQSDNSMYKFLKNCFNLNS